MDYDIKDLKIPEEVIDEYHVYKGDIIGLYQTFLKVTDYKITKLYEQLIMHPEQEAEIKAEFLEKNGKLMEYRQIAREELGPLLDKMYEMAAKMEEEQKRMEEALRAGYEYSPEADAAKAKEARENGQIIEDCDECKLESSEE